MNNGNRRWFNFASGWIRKNSQGRDYISAAANGQKATVELVARVKETGEELPLNNFAVFFEEEKKNDKSPDVRFTFSIE